VIHVILCDLSQVWGRVYSVIICDRTRRTRRSRLRRGQAAFLLRVRRIIKNCALNVCRAARIYYSVPMSVDTDVHAQHERRQLCICTFCRCAAHAEHGTCIIGVE